MNFERLIARAEHALEQVLPRPDVAPQALHKAMRHAVLGGGKRLRPLLVHAGGRVFDETGPILDAPACAVELIHAYSLVHDDLPAMDDDELRRGRPTCHVAFGEAMAILAGDALQALAFEILADPVRSDLDPAQRSAMLHCLGAACGSAGMAGGQALDLDAVGTNLDLAALEHMHQLKTGALIRASIRLGALAGGGHDPAKLDALDRCAGHLGLAFQVRDDILDVESDSATLGKTAGKDARQAKPTFPSILGMGASRRHLDELIAQALDAISALGPEADLLRQLTRYAAERNS